MNETNELRPLLFALGLCAKAGALIYGVPMICEAMKKGKPVLLVLAAKDNAQNSAKRLSDRCAFYDARLVTAPVDGEALAHAVGKSARLAAVAVTDENLARLITAKLDPDQT